MAVHRRTLRFGPDNGTLLLRTRRTGLASRVGHDLTLELTAWWAEVELPDVADAANGRVEVSMELASLKVREGVGGAVPLADRDVREIEGNARRILDVDRYPTATFDGDRITPAATGATINGTLALHGRSAPVVLEVRELAPNRWQAASTVLQTAFAIKPYSAFLGALRLHDEVEIECVVGFDTAQLPDPMSG